VYDLGRKIGFLGVFVKLKDIDLIFGQYDDIKLFLDKVWTKFWKVDLGAHQDNRGKQIGSEIHELSILYFQVLRRF